MNRECIVANDSHIGIPLNSDSFESTKSGTKKIAIQNRDSYDWNNESRFETAVY